jgi:hypothetical protein
VLHSWIRNLKETLKGFFLYNLISHLHAEKRCLDEWIMLSLFGNFIGFPFLFNYYHLRLLPHYAKRLEYWKRRVLKERDFFDRIDE